MLGLPACGSLTPETERRWLEFPPHESNHFAGSQTELTFYRVETRSIFPRHFYDAVDFRFRQSFCS